MRLVIILISILSFGGIGKFFNQSSSTVSTPNLERLQVSENGRYLENKSGDPFFWVGDTGWLLFHRLSKKEARKYLEKRASQGFNVIQAVALTQFDDFTGTNKLGQPSLLSIDPITPNLEYFDHIEWVMDLADSLNLYIALLPTWGDKVHKAWGDGPEIFDIENIGAYGEWIGNRFKNQQNLIWVVGGDRKPKAELNHVAIWSELAEGIQRGVGDDFAPLITFHNQLSGPGGSSMWFHDKEWLSFNMHQTGHCPTGLTYKKIRYDYQLEPVKPTIDGEPLYEHHPNCFDANTHGYSSPTDIRRMMYWSVFSGAMGHTYGCHDVWQFYSNDYEGTNGPLGPWYNSLDLPMANQMKVLKYLMLSRPFYETVPDSTIVLNQSTEEQEYKAALRSRDSMFLMVYSPVGGDINVSLEIFENKKVDLWWYDPRTGAAFFDRKIKAGKNVLLESPSSGRGNDWILIIDDASKKMSKPGLQN